MANIPEFETLEEAKAFIRENWEKGTACPCCGQLVKLYKRNIYAVMAADLIRLYHLDQSKYHHIGKFSNKNRSGGGDFAKLVYWGLVEEEPKPADDKKKRTSGMWRITEAGKSFAERRLRVPKYAQVYNGKLLGLTGDRVMIDDALGDKFDYDKLMKG